MLQKKDYSGKSFVNPYKRFSIQNVSKRRFFQALRRTLIILFILVFLIAGYITIFSGVMNVSQVTLSGEFQQSHYQQYLYRIQEKVVGKNIIFLQKKKVKELFSAEDVVFIAIKKIFPSTIKVTIYERLPAFQIQRGGEAFLSDREGFVLAKGTDMNLVLIEIPTSTPPIHPKAPVLSKDLFSFFQGLVDGMKSENNVKITKFVLRSKDLADFSVFSQKPWFMIVDASQDPETYVEALKTFLGEKYAIENTLTYIDLRIQDKIYYK